MTRRLPSLLLALLAGLALCCCGGKKDEPLILKPCFRFAPVANPDDRLVRIDDDAYAYSSVTESFVEASELFPYDEEGYLTRQELVGKEQAIFEYNDFGFREIVNRYYSYNPSWVIRPSKSYVYGVGIISMEKTEDKTTSTTTIVLNEDGSVKSYGDIAVAWENGNIVSIDYPDRYHASFEYSSLENPWCGVDIFSYIIMEREEVTVAPGLFHTRNIPSRMAVNEPDQPAVVFTIKAEIDASSRPVKISILNGEMSIFESFDLFYGTHDAETVHTLNI